MRKLALFMFLSLILISRASLAYDFAVIGDPSTTKAVNNIYYFFGNESITYKSILPSQVTSTSFSDVTGGIVSFADTNTISAAGITAVKTFANYHIVISDAYDFANYYYPDPSFNYKAVKINSNDYITYLMDFGNFRSQDMVGLQNPGKTSVGILLTSALQSKFGSSLTLVAKYNNTHTAYFYVNSTPNTGFYVIDLNITSNESTWDGIWHIFQPVRMVKDFPLGKYARWMANGAQWWDLTWIYNRMDTLTNGNRDIVSEKVIGTSLEGNDIRAIYIGKGNRYAIIDGDIHGDEKTGAFASLRMAELLVDYYRSDPSWTTKLNQYKVIIVPVVNPDGFVRNTRLNSRSIVESSNYNTNGVANMKDGDWTKHGLARANGTETGPTCTVTPTTTRSDIVVGIKSVNSTHFKLSMNWTSDGTPVTTPQSITWSCKETCCNLNRLFPVNANPKEPEAIALKTLLDTQNATIYANNHEACCHYSLWLIYGSELDSGNIYTKSTLFSLQQSKKEYSNLKNWGTDHKVLDTITNACILTDTSMATVNNTVIGIKDMTVDYASSIGIASTILESYVCSGSYGSMQSLWGIDTYSAIELAFLKHYDRNNEKNFSVASTSFIINTTFAGDLLTVKLDSNGYPSPSTTLITDINNKGEPVSVSIDGLNKVKNDGWYYDSTTKNITIRGAVKILTVDWNPGSSGTYTATFSQSGIPSGTSWSVSVGGTIYTSTSTSKDVSLTGAVPYTYTTPISQYVCTSGCSGSVAYNSKKANAVYSIQGGGGCGPGCYLRAIEPYILNTEPIATTLFLLLVVVEIIILILVIKILSKIEATNKKNINSRHHK